MKLFAFMIDNRVIRYIDISHVQEIGPLSFHMVEEGQVVREYVEGRIFHQNDQPGRWEEGRYIDREQQFVTGSASFSYRLAFQSDMQTLSVDLDNNDEAQYFQYLSRKPDYAGPSIEEVNRTLRERLESFRASYNEFFAAKEADDPLSLPMNAAYRYR